MSKLSREMAGFSASKSASRNASNAGLDEFFPTRWRVVIEYSAT